MLLAGRRAAAQTAPLENLDGTLSAEAPGSAKLFDGKSSKYSFDLSGGPIWSRSTHDAHWDHSGFEIAGGTTVESGKAPFFLAGTTAIAFRALDSKSFALSVPSNSIVTGISLGPLDFHARFGVSIFTIDDIHAQVSFELLSPRVGAGVGIRLGRLRIDVEAQSEYLWRWLGPSYFVRGVNFVLQLPTPPAKSPMQAAP